MLSLKSEKGFLTLISILLTVAIVSYIVYAFFKSSAKPLSVEGDRNSSYTSMVDDTRTKINRYTNKQIDALGQYTNVTVK